MRDIIAAEYAFLKANAHSRTKFTIPAPSWHRIFWHPEYSRAAYPTPEAFLRAVAEYLRMEVVAKIMALGGDYIQMDAPNYAQWHVDPQNRAAFGAWGHNIAADHAHACAREEKQRCRRPIARTILGVSCAQPK